MQKGSTASAEAQAGFMQTHCHGQSVTKLVRVPQIQRERRQGSRARRDSCYYGQSVTKLVRAPQLQ